MSASVAEFYRDKTIFITGASGFIGKVLLEKLLYSCSGLRKVYVLIRSKRGSSIKTRLNEMFDSPAFTRLKKEQPDALRKVIPVEGNLTEENLGINSTMLDQLHKEINIVFHCAASVRFDSPLKEALNMNTTSTWRLLNISRNMINLDCFIYLSTAFCHVEFEKLDERVYDATENPHDLMNMVKWMKDDALNLIEKNLLDKHPNTYTYTKRLAECLVRDEYPNLPVAIARPSIVIPAWNEPLKGWVDSLNGPSGVLIAAGKGVIRTMNCDGECKADIIPVDYVVNGLLVFTESVGRMKQTSQEIPVCNLTCGDIREINWNTVLNMSKEIQRKYPFDYPLWYPNGGMQKNVYVYKILAFFFHVIPAYLIDFLMIVFRRKRFMVRLQNRISCGLDLFSFFTMRPWYFVNDVYKNLIQNLSPEDRLKFPLDFAEIEDKEYMKRCALGGRVYCLKEKLDDLPKARRVNFIMYLLDKLVTLIFYGYIIWTIYHYSEKILRLSQPLSNMI